MIKLTQNDWRIFRRLQRKHNVSTEFLRYNLENIEKFIWFETWPRIVIRRYAVRKENRVFIIYYRLRRVLFDQSNRKMFKRMRQNIKQWSKRIVAWQKNHLGVREYVEEVVYDNKFNDINDSAAANCESACGNIEDVSKQLKEQLELLKNGRRPQSLITNRSPKCFNKSKASEENQKSDSNKVDDISKEREQVININARDSNTVSLENISSQASEVADKQFANSSTKDTQGDWQLNLESTPEKQITTQENVQPIKQLDTDEKTEKSLKDISIHQTEKLKTGLNFLDMLMCKVSGSTVSSNCLNHTSTYNTNTTTNKEKEILQRMPSSGSFKEGYQHHNEHSMDSTDGFLGFDDCERIPGMLMTPIVPHSTKNSKNSAFVSESLNEYMRLNDLETNYSIDEDKSVTKGKIFAKDVEGLMTPKTKPPHFDMPAVPENLLKFRTVAERKQYLQKFSKNYRLAIINNEASIYRELQRRIRIQKVKSASQILAQSSNSSMSFTRNGWKAASFINTEFNKYYYQVLDVDHGAFNVHLRGARGNNDEFNKTPYVSRVVKPPKDCFECCADDRVMQYLKPVKTIAEKKKKLNKDSLPSVFKPCPLSHKTFHKPLDDDTAALLLAGGSMAVVRMPTVELEVFPEHGKPLHEIAKRYLQYILPHHDISREWAEFSVSTLQQPTTIKEAEEAAAKSFNSHDLRKSYTFVIPYLNDRNHILVRRVVDRSEKLDESFEHCVEERELVPKTDFTFRQNLDLTDDVLLTCADVVSDMINTVAISCSENSFIKTDPDGFNIEEVTGNNIRENSKHNASGSERSMPSPTTAPIASGGIGKKYKKQNSLLLELKRLNATIIDAAVKSENDKKPCPKDYCQMGCICVSIDEVAPHREHCGKTKCMLECSCKSSNQSRIMRLETDGRTLTTEDAFMLRRKATARLARMEKEFTSTVVLTENETLLINETNNDKKRRCTKAPKRYEDFTDTEDEQRKNSPKKTALTTIDKEKHLAVEIKEIYEPVYVKDSILERLQHCTVNLVPLPDMDNIAPWCMVHNLYKCFCKGRAVEGKPMVIEKEEANTTVEHDVQQKTEQHDSNINAKAKYTFDKIETKKHVYNDHKDQDKEANGGDKAIEDFIKEDQYDNDDYDDDGDWTRERKRKRKETTEARAESQVKEQKMTEDSEASVEDEYTKEFPTNPCNTENQRQKRSLLDVRERFYASRFDSCRRHIPTPRRMFLYCNRKRRLNVLKYIKENENDKTRLLLNEHVMRSVYYHKIDSQNHKKDNNSTGVTKVKSEKLIKSKATQGRVTEVKQIVENLPSTDVTKKKFSVVNEVVDLVHDDDDDTSISSVVNKNKDDNSQMSSTSTKSCTSFEKLFPDSESAPSTNHFQICSSGGVITVKKYSTSMSVNNTDQNKSTVPATTKAAKARDMETVAADEDVDELKVPKISSCFSLNVKANAPKAPPATTAVNEEERLDFTSATSVHSAAFSHNQSHQFKEGSSSALEKTAACKDTRSAAILDMDNENIKDVYNNVIKTMNSLVSKKMQDIDCALQRESHIIPAPNPDILCIMKWCNFLEAFCQGFAYIWQVKMKDATFLAITIKNVMPLIIGAMGIVNITALKVEKMPLMGKMLLHKFRNKETEKLAVVMQGKQSHWVVKGFLKSDPSTACNKPTPDSHPSLTKKINVLCSLLVKQRQKEQKKKDKFTTQSCSPTLRPATEPMIAPPQTSPKQLPVSQKNAHIASNRRIVAIQPRPATDIQSPSPSIVSEQQPTPQPFESQICEQSDADASQKSHKQNETDTGKIVGKVNPRKRKADSSYSTSLMRMDTYNQMNSNIEFRSVTQSDIDEIFLPELHKLDHKWLVLDLHNDFSHIFVPDFRDLVSLDRIQKVMNFAREKSKIVKLQFFQNAPFDAFVTPKSLRKIYFGPLTTNMKAPTLILLQSVDGQMMVRELYQLKHNIVKMPEARTKAFWLVHVKGQTHFEMDINAINQKASVESFAPTSSTNTPLATSNIIKTTTECTPLKIVNEEGEKTFCNDNDDDDDEDCMIIDDPVENSNGNVLSQSNAMPAPLPMQPFLAPQTNNVDSALPTAQQLQSLLKMPNTNTVIKPIKNTNLTGQVVINVPQMMPTNKAMPILTLPPNTIITGINPNTSTDNSNGAQVVGMPKAALITGIESAPPEAPYSSTIFITSTNSPSTTAPVIPATISTAPIGSTTITSNSSESVRLKENEMKSACSTNSAKIMRQALEAGAIKRRRISIFCSNKYDKISENLAVDAVIRKILPDNAQDIQINESSASLTQPETVTIVGTTQISKTASNNESNILPPKLTSSKKIGDPIKPKPPIVFDVNFMDDGDEPTASIVIKPTSVTETSSTTTTTSTKTPTTDTTRTTATNAALTTAPACSTTLSPNTTSIALTAKLPTTLNTTTAATSSTNTTSTDHVPNKIKLPTVPNTTSVATTNTNTTCTGKGKLNNSLLSSKQTKAVSQFSTPKPIASKAFTSTSSSSLSSSSPNNSVSPNPFPFRRSSISMKVHKVASSAATTTANIPSNTPSSTSTLTVKQVQEMLNKPSVNGTAINSTKSSPAAKSSPSIPKQLLPTIKATITAAKAATISPTSTVTTSSGYTVTSAVSAAPAVTTTAPETNSSNSTLTISKVQSFGMSQKIHNTNKNQQTIISPPAQTVIKDINEKASIPPPPAHIQYGYIVSEAHVNQKFVAKRVAEEFYVKVPSVGILKLQGLTAVNNYLNKYVNQILKKIQVTPAVWQFVAASKAVQMQNHQKSLLVRKTKTNNVATAKNVTTKFNNSLEEPILIDD